MVSVLRQSNSSCIDLPAACNIMNCTELAVEIDSMLQMSGRVTLDGSQVESVDFSFVQLLASAAASVGSDFGRIELRAPAPCIQHAFARAGMADFPVFATKG